MSPNSRKTPVMRGEGKTVRSRPTELGTAGAQQTGPRDPELTGPSLGNAGLVLS